MGDYVEELLDRTLPELHFISKHGLMTKPEIHQLVQTRRNFEYRLLSRRATRFDYLRYASFEASHAALLRNRIDLKNIKPEKSSRFLHRTSTRTNMILSRATHKFRGDIDLWLHYARHCIKSDSKKAASKVFARALALNPTSEKLWVAAISFQCDTLNDTTSARNLSQSALRCLPKSRSLYRQYFQFELAFLCRLRSDRCRHDLEIPESTLFWKGGVPRAVFDSAIKCLKEASPLTAHEISEYLSICNSVPFSPNELCDHIHNVLVSTFPKHPEALIATLRMPLDRALMEVRAVELQIKRKSQTSDNDDKSKDEFQKSIKSQDTARGSLKQVARNTAENLVKLMSNEQNSQFQKCCQDYGIVELISQYLEEDEKRALEENCNKLQRNKNALLAIEDVGQIDSVEKWKLYLNLEKAHRSVTVESTRAALKKKCGVPLRNQEQEEIAVLWISWEEKNNDIQGLRHCYDELLQLSQSSCVAFAAANAEARMQKPGFDKRVRRLFGLVEKDRGKSDVQFWIRWWKFEQNEMRDGKQAAQVYWKATSKLKDAHSFTELVQVSKVLEGEN